MIVAPNTDWPVLYSFRRCPYAMRARMALLHGCAQAGVRCELREVLLKDKPASMLALSAKATVPVLLLPDQRVLDESWHIMRWAMACGADGGECGGEYGGADLNAQDLACIERNDGYFKYHLDRYKYPQRFQIDLHTDLHTDGVDHMQLACVFLAELEQRLMVSKFLCGDVGGIVDWAIFPFVRQFAAVDYPLFESLPFVHVQGWLAAWLEDAYFQAVMRKYPAWKPNDKPVFLGNGLGYVCDNQGG